MELGIKTEEVPQPEPITSRRRGGPAPGGGDGYAWIKYSHKVVNAGKVRRYYYNCSEKPSTGCLARKTVDRDTSIPKGDHSQDQVTIHGSHNHPPSAQPRPDAGEARKEGRKKVPLREVVEGKGERADQGSVEAEEGEGEGKGEGEGEGEGFGEGGVAGPEGSLAVEGKSDWRSTKEKPKEERASGFQTVAQVSPGMGKGRVLERSLSQPGPMTVTANTERKQEPAEMEGQQADQAGTPTRREMVHASGRQTCEDTEQGVLIATEEDHSQLFGDGRGCAPEELAALGHAVEAGGLQQAPPQQQQAEFRPAQQVEAELAADAGELAENWRQEERLSVGWDAIEELLQDGLRQHPLSVDDQGFPRQQQQMSSQQMLREPQGQQDLLHPQGSPPPQQNQMQLGTPQKQHPVADQQVAPEQQLPLPHQQEQLFQQQQVQLQQQPMQVQQAQVPHQQQPVPHQQQPAPHQHQPPHHQQQRMVYEHQLTAHHLPVLLPYQATQQQIQQSNQGTPQFSMPLVEIPRRSVQHSRSLPHITVPSPLPVDSSVSMPLLALSSPASVHSVHSEGFGRAATWAPHTVHRNLSDDQSAAGAKLRISSPHAHMLPRFETPSAHEAGVREGPAFINGGRFPVDGPMGPEYLSGPVSGVTGAPVDQACHMSIDGPLFSGPCLSLQTSPLKAEQGGTCLYCGARPCVCSGYGSVVQKVPSPNEQPTGMNGGLISRQHGQATAGFADGHDLPLLQEQWYSRGPSSQPKRAAEGPEGEQQQGYTAGGGGGLLPQSYSTVAQVGGVGGTGVSPMDLESLLFSSDHPHGETSLAGEDAQFVDEFIEYLRQT